MARAVFAAWAVGLCAGVPGALAADAARSAAATASDAQKPTVAEALGRHLLGTSIPIEDVKDFVEARIQPLPEPKSVAEWERYADRARSETLKKVVFVGEATGWRAVPTRPVWLETIDGGPGYKIKKLRYEVAPGLWIPALLYEPTEFQSPKVPVSLAVNGHDRPGKAADYKQIRCINQAKRGMIVLNIEFLGFGQLNGPNFDHYRLNQIDLCGTSGLAPFYLAMSRGLDILLAHPHADPARVAVQGLSGGAWQTIVIASLDTRVTLCNPVSGFAPLRTRLQYLADLGDPEQAPADLETVSGYTQMTALLAPRPALLTNNIADECCFRAEHTLPPLLAVVRPIYELYGKADNLRTHVNRDPGTHNFGVDNLQAFYAMLKDFFFADRPDVTATEIASQNEVKKAEQLNVALPPDNGEFHSLASRLMSALPRDAKLPGSREELAVWQEERRALLRKVVRGKTLDLASVTIATRTDGPYAETDYWLRIGKAWTVPVVELSPAHRQGTTIVIADGGRAAATKIVEERLQAGERVLAADLCSFGELKIVPKREYIPADFMLAIATVGDRPLGVQSGQLLAIAGWLRKQEGKFPRVVAVGPRSSLIATVAAGLDSEAIGALELHQSLGSLKEIIEQNLTAEHAPELFCFGLLERFDVPQLVTLIAPRPVHFHQPSARVRSELAPLARLYATLGVDFDPTK